MPIQTVKKNINQTQKQFHNPIMVLKSPSFLLISAFMATSALLGVSASLSGWETPALDTVPDAISPGLQIDEGPVVGAPAASLPPGLAFLDKNDPTAIELAKFAIDEHNKEAKDEIKFAGILETIYTNLEGGKSYSLVIEATNNTGFNAYDVKILVERGNKKLVAFNEM